MDLQQIKNRFDIIGNDAQLNRALEIAVQVAATDLSVLINGESGVGKEVFSHIIHSLSLRKHSPFIAVNCGAIPEGTIDSELFGHEKGAFTSAGESRKGYFESVNGGTIFLDEIGEMPLGTQARLLRVLESGEYIRVGSSKVMKTDVRIIAATNKDLLALTKTGKFREDLYYRLNTVPIMVPSLRNRKEDIPLLFRKFAADFAHRYRSKPVQLSPEAQQILMEYAWPGNIRELKNIAEQVSVLSDAQKVDDIMVRNFIPTQNNAPTLYGAALPFHNPQAEQQQQSATDRELLYKIIFDIKREIQELKYMIFNLNGSKKDIHSFENMAPFPVNNRETLVPYMPEDSYENDKPEVFFSSNDEMQNSIEIEESLSLEDMEKEYIAKALKKHKGKRKDASLELGISDRTLYRKIKDYGLEDL